MKAIRQTAYGAPHDVLEAADVDLREPGPGEVLVRVRASSVNPADWFVVTGRPAVMRPAFGGLRRPGRRPGKDVAGVVEAVGPGVTRLAVGDEVYGELAGEAWAEHVVAPESALATAPAGLDPEEQAALPLVGVTALQAVRAAAVPSGGHLLVVGASGGVGSIAVQVAAAQGVVVTGVGGLGNLDLLRSLGATTALAHDRDDWTAPGPRYDAVLDLVGVRSARAYRDVLAPGGTFVASAGGVGGPVLGPLPYLAATAATGLVRRPRTRVFAARTSTADLAELTALVEAGQVRPVVERSYALADVADALVHKGRGHARGKTVLVV